MIPTFFTTLALGTITTMVASIMALSSWVSGSAILQGHVFWDNTNVTNSEYVGTQQTVKHTAAGYDFITNGTQTGFVVKADGTTTLQRFPVTCTATGGLTKYPTCITASPYTTTGSLEGLALDCGGIGVGTLTVSGSFVKSRSAVSGSPVIPNFTRKAIASGALAGYSGSGMTWNPADLLRINTITSIPTTTNFNCTMVVTTRDKYGS